MKQQLNINKITDAMKQVLNGEYALAHRALLKANYERDSMLVETFRARNCGLEEAEISNFSELECWSLVHAISRQLYWEEPPLFSVNNVLVDIPPQSFKFSKQIIALVSRLTVLHDLEPH